MLAEPRRGDNSAGDILGGPSPVHNSKKSRHFLEIDPSYRCREGAERSVIPGLAKFDEEPIDRWASFLADPPALGPRVNPHSSFHPQPDTTLTQPHLDPPRSQGFHEVVQKGGFKEGFLHRADSEINDRFSPSLRLPSLPEQPGAVSGKRISSPIEPGVVADSHKESARLRLGGAIADVCVGGTQFGAVPKENLARSDVSPDGGEGRPV